MRGQIVDQGKEQIGDDGHRGQDHDQDQRDRRELHGAPRRRRHRDPLHDLGVDHRRLAGASGSGGTGQEQWLQRVALGGIAAPQAGQWTSLYVGENLRSWDASSGNQTSVLLPRSSGTGRSAPRRAAATRWPRQTCSAPPLGQRVLDTSGEGLQWARRKVLARLCPPGNGQRPEREPASLPRQFRNTFFSCGAERGRASFLEKTPDPFQSRPFSPAVPPPPSRRNHVVQPGITRSGRICPVNHSAPRNQRPRVSLVGSRLPDIMTQPRLVLRLQLLLRRSKGPQPVELRFS